MYEALTRSAVDRNRMAMAARRRLPVVHFAVDSSLWMTAIPLAVWLRYDDRFAELGANLILPIIAAVVLQGAFGFLAGLYRRQWRYGSFDEVRVVASTAATVGVVLTVGSWQWHGIPRSVPVLAAGLTLLGQIAARSMWRLRNEKARRPSVDHLQRLGGVGAGDIRPVNEADLLGRHPADIDPEAVSHYITAKRVLVTGAGGSIGSELCRQLARFEPSALMMLDRDATCPGHAGPTPMEMVRQ